MTHGQPIGSKVASNILNVDRVTLIRWVKAGRITPVGRISDTPTGAFLFNRADVEKLAAATKLGKSKTDIPLSGLDVRGGGDKTSIAS